ncbi:uncharacterized protein LOC120236280 isoform X2 [Hyaena hyaena]|uniref:uncharacterized protein LOC120236280 isoform X2 n=1 Tax=Hyaena hyaena TaxID=95912 RepID=UPI001921F651|nr:uncharacterized protein LOC120236280 isoform X2 [Hyaena hyaena]
MSPHLSPVTITPIVQRKKLRPEKVSRLRNTGVTSGGGAVTVSGSHPGRLLREGTRAGRTGARYAGPSCRRTRSLAVGLILWPGAVARAGPRAEVQSRDDVLGLSARAGPEVEARRRRGPAAANTPLRTSAWLTCYWGPRMWHSQGVSEQPPWRRQEATPDTGPAHCGHSGMPAVLRDVQEIMGPWSQLPGGDDVEDPQQRKRPKTAGSEARVALLRSQTPWLKPLRERLPLPTQPPTLV